MALAVPDYANVTNADQAGIDAVDFDAIVAGFDAFYVVSGCAVSQRGAGANLSVDVTAGQIVSAGVIATVAGGNVVVTPDATNPRFTLISSNSAGTVVATSGTAAVNPVFPAIPAGNVLLAAVYTAANAASVVNANIVDKRIMWSAPLGVYSGASGSDSTLRFGRTADEMHIGVAAGTTEFSDAAAGDYVSRLTDTAKTMRFGVGALGSASKLRITSTAVTVPSGVDLVIGTKSTKSGVLALSALGNTVTPLGQFTSTAGAMALRLHLHLVTGGTQKTKTYEFVVDTATDTTNTYYKVLPADQSVALSGTSDIILIAYRPSTATTTWQFWVATSAVFTSTGALTWSVESYGDSIVTFASTLSPATATPGLPVSTLHPSNSLDTVGGLIGIGTDAPTALLDLSSAGSANGAGLRIHGANAGDSVAIQMYPNQSATAVSIYASGSNGFPVSDAVIGDMALYAPAVRIGNGSASTLRVTTTDAQINNGVTTAMSVPRGAGGAGVVSGSPPAATTTSSTTQALVSGLTDIATNNIVSGRRYLVVGRLSAAQSVANDAFLIRLVVGVGSAAPLAASTTYICTLARPNANHTNAADYNFAGSFVGTAATDGAGQVAAGVRHFSAVVVRTGTSTGTLTVQGTQDVSLAIVDIGT